MANKMTDRQQEIKKLLGQNKTPPEIAKAMGISDNGVYQHIRRMREAGHLPKAGARRPAPAKAAAKAPARKTAPQRTSGRKSGAKAPAKPAARRQAPTPQGKELTPLESIQQRKAQLVAKLDEVRAEVQERRSALEAGEAELKALESGEELRQLDIAERVLKGELPKVAKNRQRQAESNGKAEEAPPTPVQAAPEPAPEPEPQPEPQSAPEPASEGEERPGVPTVPEFAEEDGREAVMAQSAAEGFEPSEGDAFTE